MEALREKDPNPEDYTGQNANAGLEAPPDHLRRHNHEPNQFCPYRTVKAEARSQPVFGQILS
jgi:hypothetical protein